MGFIDSIKGLFKDKEESNIVPQLLGGDQVLVLAEIGFESNIAPQLRQRISDTLSNHDLYEKTNSMEANMELYEAELWEIQIDNDEDLFLSNTRYKDDLDVKKVVYDRVSDRRQLAGIKCAYRDRVMNEHDAQKGLELAERYRDSKGVAVFTKAVEYFEVTGAPELRNIDTRRLDKCLLEGSSPHSRNASYTEIAARLQLMDIVKNSVPSDQYKEDGIIYPNDWRKYARKIDSEIEEMEKMGLDRSRFINTCQGIGKAFTNRMEQVLKEIKTEVDKNNKKTRNEYLASDRRSVKDWGKIERESNQGRSCKEREISSPVKYPGRE